ncbi:MAG: hypothetical protein JWO03_842 [Bacteroidetes bacterium]|nr:hypothetical protein [Bacteroidota bacterium]
MDNELLNLFPMKTKMKYLLPALLSSVLMIILYQWCKSGVAPFSCGGRSFVSHEKNEYQSKKPQVIHDLIDSYQREMHNIIARKKAIEKQKSNLAREIAQVRADTSNSVEAGMRLSFQEGIYDAQSRRSQKAINDTKLEVAKLHIIYKALVSDKGYNRTEFELLMCLADSEEAADTHYFDFLR